MNESVRISVERIKRWGADSVMLQNDALKVVEYLESIGYAKWYRAEEVSRDVHDSGDIWWWDDEEGYPIPVNIGKCVMDDYYFACIGQWGWTRPQKLTDMGGWWTPCIPPVKEETSDD